MSASEASSCASSSADDTHKISRANDKVSGMLVNVFGLKLPNEMFSQAARSANELSDILHQYAKAVEKSER
jgi:hypothetical protein